MIIDAHMHLQDSDSKSIAKLIHTMNSAEVDLGVLLQVDAETVTGRRISNDFMAEIMNKYSEQFICFGSVDPHKGRIAVKEVERIAKDLGLRGLKFFPSIQLFYPSDEIMYPIYEKAQELELPLLFHSGAPFSAGTHKLKYNHPILLDDVAIDFPDLKIAAAHLGNPWFMEIYALAERHQNFYFDISGRAREFLPLLPWKLFEAKIADKMLFGTDMQHTHDEYIDEVRHLPISEVFKKKILGDNAAKFLDLKP